MNNSTKYCEEQLKRFIKKSKNISYSTAVLVYFLITGFVSYSESGENLLTRTELSHRIYAEKLKISQEIEENTDLLKDIDLKILKLKRRGQFWIKPLDKSYQFFFNFNWRNNSKNKNNTSYNFNTPEYSNTNSNISSKYDTFYNKKYYGVYGIVRNPLEFTDSITFGVNIVPKRVKEKTVEIPKVTIKKVTLSDVPVPDKPTIVITSPKIEAPKTKSLEPPTAPSIKVNSPEEISTVSKIKINEINSINVAIGEPKVSEPTVIKAPKVSPPATPDGFEPRIIRQPDKPEVKEPDALVINLPPLKKFGTDPEHYKYYWRDGNYGDTSQTTIVNGKIWKNNTDSIHVKEYVAHNTLGNGENSFTSPQDKPENAHLEEVEGKTTYNKILTLNDGEQKNTTSRKFFMTLLDIPYSYFGKEVVMSINSGKSVVELETEGKINLTLEQLKESKRFSEDEEENNKIFEKVKKYRNYSPSKDNSSKSSTLYFNNKGSIYLGKGVSFLTVTTHTDGQYRINVIENSGNIVGVNNNNNNNDNSYGFYHSPDTSKETNYVYVNSGNMEFNAKESAAMLFSYNSKSYAKAPEAVFLNTGVIDIYGKKSYGVAFNEGDYDSGIRKGTKFIFDSPVNLYGDKSIGFYNLENNLYKEHDSFSTFKATIGKKNNIHSSKVENIDGTYTEYKSDSNEDGKEEEWVDNSVGVYNKIQKKLELSLPQLDIEKYSKNSVGVYNESGKINIEDGNLRILGGEENIGLYAKGGDIDFNGNITMGSSDLTTDGGNNDGIKNVGIYSDSDIDGDIVRTVNLNGELKSYDKIPKDSVGVYAKGIINLNDKIDIKMGTSDLKNDGSTAIYATGEKAKVKIAEDKDSTIEINGIAKNGTKTNKGVALYSENGAGIDAKGITIKIKDAAAAAVSVGQNSNIDLSNATIEYDGSVSAIYSDGTGKVDLSGAKLTLRGKSTAFDLDFKNSSPITISNETKIYPKSNDVIVFNLKNATGLTTEGGITAPVKKKIEDQFSGANVQLTSLIVKDDNYKNYKLAAVDGGEITLGDLDEKPIKAGETGTQAQKDGDEYYNHFLGQRLKATATGKTLSAVLSNEEAERYEDKVVGFEMNSSKKATSVEETALILKNSKVIADRTEKGTKGTVGAFINYGKIDIDKDSEILVEKESNIVNDKSVGVYAVNGSIVENKGSIRVGGKNSVGILALSLRVDSTGEKIKNEFGKEAIGQEKITITNDKEITMNDGSIGIYALNNTDDTTPHIENHNVANNIVTNNGTITVGASDGKNTAVGIYGDKVTILSGQSGTINLGDKAVGIFATNGSAVGKADERLGTVNFKGNNGVALYLEKKSEINAKEITISNDDDQKKGNVGLFVDKEDKFITNFKVITGNAKNITSYYSKGSNLKVTTDFEINNGGIGMAAAQGKDLSYTSNLTIGKNSTGILGSHNNIELSNEANLNLTGNGSTGIYSDSESNTTVKGKINLYADNVIGVYTLDGTVKEEGYGHINFDNNSKNSLGYYLAGSNWTGGSSSPTINYNHNSNNIFIYAQGFKRSEGNLIGSTITLDNDIQVKPEESSSEGKKAIGIYLDTSIKNGESEYIDNTLDLSKDEAKIDSGNDAIGVYAKNDSTKDNYNIVKNPKFTSSEGETISIYVDGNLKLQGEGYIKASDKNIGIYANKGKIKIVDPQQMELQGNASGIYLTNGAYLEDSEIKIKNIGNEKIAGIYYTKGAATEQVTNKTDISVDDGNNLLALYVDNGINLKNEKNITISKNSGNIATFVTGNSTFTNSGKISLKGNDNDLTQALGIYVESGKVSNENEIEVEDKVKDNSLSIAMGAIGEKVELENKGTVDITGDVVGMYIGGKASGTNSKDITAKNSNDIKSIGVYVKGEGSKFTNKGTISSENIALALADTKKESIKNTGTFKLTQDRAVGVYAKNSAIDFDITPETEKNKTVALYAEGNTKIYSTITSSEGRGHVGVYVKDSGVKFEKGSKVIVNNGAGTDFGVGIFTDSGYEGDFNANIDQKGKETIGLFLGNNNSKGSLVKYTGEINNNSGIGVYVPMYSKFTAKGATFNVKGGTAVFLEGGKVDLGKSGATTINFVENTGMAIYQDGGEIVTGKDLYIKGSGNLLKLKNADSTIDSEFTVKAEGVGIDANYDSPTKDYTVKIGGNNGKISLNNKAIGVSVLLKNSNNNAVSIINEGTISTKDGAKETVGIFANGVNIENKGSINIGESGVAIYATDKDGNNDPKLTSSNITLKGNNAIGILADESTIKDFTIGTIANDQNTNSQIGVYIKDSKVESTIKDFDIKVGNNGKGLIFENGEKFNVTSTNTNNITVENTTHNNYALGIATIGTSGTVDKTNINIGKGSLGLYVKEGELNFKSGELKSTTGKSILAYADTKGKIKLTDIENLEIGKGGIALGTNGGEISTDNSTKITVNGGIGAFISGDSDNISKVSDKFEIKVNSGIGVYAKGNVDLYPKVIFNEFKGDKAKAYIFEDISKEISIDDPILLDENATEQIGIYAKGTGKGLKVNGIQVKGNKNTGIYNSVDQLITNNGEISVAASTLNKESVGIYSKNGEILTNKGINVGKYSLGIYGENVKKITQDSETDNVIVDENAIGIFVKNDNLDRNNPQEINVTGNVEVKPNVAIGIQATNMNIILNKDLTIGDKNSKGIFSEENGNITVNGNISVGENSIGIYKKGISNSTEDVVKTGVNKNIEVKENSYGILTENAPINNNSNLSVEKNGVGIYANNGNITSKGDVTVLDNGVGLFLKNTGTSSSTLSSSGKYKVANNRAVGFYLDNANAKIDIKSGTSLEIGDTDSIGINSKGKGDISVNGNINVGVNSIGVYKKGIDKITLGNTSSSNMLSIGNNSYGVYYEGDLSVSGNNKIESYTNMSLGKEAIGIFARNSDVYQRGNITVGETYIAENGYEDSKSNRNSVGIFGNNSNIVYDGGTLTVDKPLSVGMYALNNGSITFKSGTINVTNGGTGIMLGKNSKEIKIENGAVINVSGRAKDLDEKAGEKNVSTGIVAYSGEVTNNGIINIEKGATGMYIAGGAILKNQGTINIDAATGGKIIDRDSAADTGDIGGLSVDINGEVTINDKVINGGKINIKGDLNMEGIGIDISTENPVICADKISGTAYVLPNFSKGNSVQKITIEDVFQTPPEGIGAFNGEIKSKSVSWIAKISKKPGSSTTTRDITVARIPYKSLIAGEKYENLGGGLEELRLSIPETKESNVFKSLDGISNHGEFAKAVADIRGDIYSNIQERMRTVEETFEKSYIELLDSYNVTKDVNKFSVIYSNGKHKDDTIGATGYDYTSTGLLYLNDNEKFEYGEKYGWSLGVIGTKFDFKGQTNKDSKEKILSGKLGVHYQKALDKMDKDAQIKFISRLELTTNIHKAKRNTLIEKDSYTNKTTYYSTDLSLKNKVFYDYDFSTRWSIKPYASLNTSYGRIWNISENGTGISLNVKGGNYFLITPNIGAETKYLIPFANSKQIILKADANLGYNVTELYSNTNKAKIEGTSTGYYNLTRPKNDRVNMKLGLEFGIEKTDNYGVTFRAEYAGSNNSDINYGVRFNYKF